MDLFDPKSLIETFGTIGLILIIFAESGLLLGLIFPGDSLLFTAGLLAGSNKFGLNIVVVAGGVFIAAVAGAQVGYWLGRKYGPALFKRPDSRLFKREYVDQSREFFDKHGAKTIVLARFVPIVRTFAPIVAGVGHMEYRTFLKFNVLGGVLWGAGVTTLGYFLGEVDFIKNNIEIAIVAIVAVSLTPVAIEMWRHRKQR